MGYGCIRLDYALKGHIAGSKRNINKIDPIMKQMKLLGPGNKFSWLYYCQKMFCTTHYSTVSVALERFFRIIMI